MDGLQASSPQQLPLMPAEQDCLQQQSNAGVLRTESGYCLCYTSATLGHLQDQRDLFTPTEIASNAIYASCPRVGTFYTSHRYS